MTVQPLDDPDTLVQTAIRFKKYLMEETGEAKLITIIPVAKMVTVIPRPDGVLFSDIDPDTICRSESIVELIAILNRVIDGKCQR